MTRRLGAAPTAPLRALPEVSERLMGLAFPGARRQFRTLRDVDHRPWPLPDRPWFMAQTWERLLFAHWPVPVESLRRVLPPSVPLDTYAGSAYVGITPFRVATLRLHGTPPLPRASYFPELNVRTYVSVGGKPGIWFLSLDAARAEAVFSARRFYRLPYFRARMGITRDRSGLWYESTRVQPDGPPARFAGRYEPVGAVFNARPGSLEHWFTERYCLYTLDERARILRADIHHPPWPLQAAAADIDENTMTAGLGFEPDGAPLLHFSSRQDVLLWHLAETGEE